ncbi:fumarylacetoacetate hydrolase family protein [Chitinimonas sp. BJB300]|uniref:fumarylacetoacetate hydrolase family protein n=1 Tax=Chitinimonas sp. BJB300 TaxID=1559339 RepID=UPI000C10C110|nr:fumarylacetoacetate hydrolase family protein [Chitinimonas sp. BJB300]PHV10809.1 isomerase/hydrolase [Chitinimonas sp. BJB300]TSJ87828.1 fumarylacetoacetate hydrolase family protein [Chitinimonas sp. BJB300]
MPAIRFTDHRELAVANIFCIGRNYAAHAAELGNRVEPEPVVFLKPTSALQHEDQVIALPTHSKEVHYEGELVLVVGKAGKHIRREAALEHIAGYGLGLDLTARDLQTAAKEKGLPWSVAKGFDGSACVSRFLPAQMVPQPLEATFWLDVNGTRRQDGDCTLMIYDLPYIMEYLSSRFTLQVGDLIYTGTPAGVGPLQSGDTVEMGLLDKLNARFMVA